MKKCIVCQINRDDSLYKKGNNTCLYCRRKRWTKTLIRDVAISYGIKQCTKCGEFKSLLEFPKESYQSCGYSSNCKECVNRQHREEYYPNNKESMNARATKWRNDNHERFLEIQAKCRRNMSVERKREIIEYNKEYRKAHPHRVKAWAIRRAKRRRGYGYNPLNEPFDGAEFHHLHLDGDINIGIWIPKDLHKSIWHSSITGQGMDDINELAFKFLNGEIK